jgi:flagellar basal-body rod protein FlgG
MFRSLDIAATGMAAQESQLDAISNNLANASTVGYKKIRADFQDHIYQTVQASGAQTSSTTQSPTGLQVGSGVRMVATTRQFSQGALTTTGNPLDIAIEGNGFFVVQQPDGTPAYSRAGTMKTDAQGRLVTAEGMPIEPAITIPPDAVGVTIGSEGQVSVSIKGRAAPTQVGQITIANFVNPAGLSALGHSLLQATASSGDPQVGNPGADGRGTLLQNTVEQSNVEVVQEMIGLISAQRTYDVNSKVVQAADEMLRSATQMR